LLSFLVISTKLSSTAEMAALLAANSDQFCLPCDENPTEAPAERIVIPSDVVAFTPDDEEVCVIGTRDGKVTKIEGLDGMNKLKTLILRSCLIAKMDGVETLTTLSKLELYDNQIEEVVGISRLSNLRILDLSFNAIHEMYPRLVDCVPLLEELYMAQNKLKQIQGLEGLVHLRILDLGANRLRTIEGLETNITLRSLWLGKNKIERITGLETLVNLEQLDIQNNRLTTLGDGLCNLVKLRELYLACNRIPDVNGLPQGNLEIVDLSTNGVQSLAGVESLTTLQELWLTSSALSSFEDLHCLTALPKLTCLYLEHSPIAKDFEYRIKITQMLPMLQQLDATLVTRR